MQCDRAIKLRQAAAYRDEKQLLHPKLDARMIRIELPNAPVLTLLLRLHNDRLLGPKCLNRIHATSTQCR